METKESPEAKRIRKVGTYKGYDIYADPSVHRETVATMLPNQINIAEAIVIRSDAYEILKSRQDFLERIYEHELRENTSEEEVGHNLDSDILKFLRDNGYDFGDLEYDDDFLKKLN